MTVLAVYVEKRLGRFKLAVRFEAASGAIALFGPSGAGKTSLVNMIAGLLTPDRGPHGISFSFTGSSADAVLTKIDGEQNEGGGAGKKNWQYWANDACGDRSFATFELQAQDVVVLQFTTEQGK